MGLFDRLFGRHEEEPRYTSGTFKLLDGYLPCFTTWHGGVYEDALCRSAIDTIARHASKLQVTVQGTARPTLRTQLTKAPNEVQPWSQFLARTATLLYVNNTMFICPSLNEYSETVGVYPIAPYRWELVQATDGEGWIRFYFGGGRKVAFRLSEVGIMTRYQNRNDLFGETNNALHATMQLIHIQRQGIEEAAKNSATYRFMARIGNFTKAEDLTKERKRFDEENMSDGGGLLLFPNTYCDVKQITQQTYAVDAEQLKAIQTNVYNYFGVNEDVIQNKAYGDAFSAFYEGALEPFAIQLSEVLTRMLYSPREQANGNEVFFTANRMQYMTNADKLSVSTQLIDRGIISLNDAREIWNLPPVEGGDIRIIRGEYYNAESKVQEGDNDYGTD